MVLNVLLRPRGNPPSAVEKNASIITLDADQDWPLKVYFVPLNARVLVPVSAGHYHVVGQGTEIASYHMLVYAPIWTPLSLTAFRTIIVLMVTSVLLQDRRILEFANRIAIPLESTVLVAKIVNGICLKPVATKVNVQDRGNPLYHKEF